jgi:hypothetical protein
MFVPNGYLEFHRAAALVPDFGDDGGRDNLQGERLGSALASGDLIAHGVVVGAKWQGDGEIEELGTIRELRPEAWRMPRAREAVLGKDGTGCLYQDDYILTPIIQRTAFFAWRKAEFDRPLDTMSEQQSCATPMPGLSSGVHAVPSGYVTFDQIRIVARGWADAGVIDHDLLLLLDPPDTDSLTEALASGSLPAFGISKRTGEIIHLPPSTWRMGVSGSHEVTMCCRDRRVIHVCRLSPEPTWPGPYGRQVFLLIRWSCHQDGSPRPRFVRPRPP